MLYVTMTDKVLSGWGEADGKINKLIFECENRIEAETVMDNARNRGDMNRINLCINKPNYSSNRYYAQTKTKEEYPSWYKKGYFNK